jgi:hypothetical protein
MVAGTEGLKAAFFCLLFFAAAKKSRCRPAQGQRLRREGANADASEENKRPRAPHKRQQTKDTPKCLK